MKRKSLYSRATKRRMVDRAGGAPIVIPERDFASEPSFASLALSAVRRFVKRHERVVPAAIAALFVLAVIGGWQALYPGPRALTQWDVDNAVHYTLSHTPPGPDSAAIAANNVMPSVVRVDGYLSPEHAAQLEKATGEPHGRAHDKSHPAPPAAPPGDDKDAPPFSTGSGVVIDDKGDILTNLHVIHSTDRWVLTFWDGSKSDAVLVTAQPENDLAVIRAKTEPDDLKPATLASTADLHSGDTVVAVGFPFGIGPSVSSGVVAGLKRAFDDPDDKDKPTLSNLIQFDAAVNPGNSGGPLVNRDGEVVGIVTALYNPTGQHVFAGMGFAVPIENAAKAVGDNPL